VRGDNAGAEGRRGRHDAVLRQQRWGRDAAGAEGADSEREPTEGARRGRKQLRKGPAEGADTGRANPRKKIQHGTGRPGKKTKAWVPEERLRPLRKTMRWQVATSDRLELLVTTRRGRLLQRLYGRRLRTDSLALPVAGLDPHAHGEIAAGDEPEKCGQHEEPRPGAHLPNEQGNPASESQGNE
jgi:hypothetical protein